MTKDFDLKRILLGKENISSNQKKQQELITYDIDFLTSDESLAVPKKQVIQTRKASVVE